MADKGYRIGDTGVTRKGVPWIITGEFTYPDEDTPHAIASYGGTCVDCKRDIAPITNDERPTLEDLFTGTAKPIERAVMVTDGLCSDCAPELA